MTAEPHRLVLQRRRGESPAVPQRPGQDSLRQVIGTGEHAPTLPATGRWHPACEVERSRTAIPAGFPPAPARVHADRRLSAAGDRESRYMAGRRSFARRPPPGGIVHQSGHDDSGPAIAAVPGNQAWPSRCRPGWSRIAPHGGGSGHPVAKAARDPGTDHAHGVAIGMQAEADHELGSAATALTRDRFGLLVHPVLAAVRNVG